MPRSLRDKPWLGLRDGVYQIEWYKPPTAEEKRRNPHAAGRTKRLGLRTRSAKEAQHRLNVFVESGYHKVDSSLTVAAALQRYQEDHVEPRVRDKERALIAIRHLRTYFADTPLPTIDVDACHAFIRARAEGKVNGGWKAGEQTARRELAVLLAATHHARKRKLIARDLLPEIELPKITHTNSVALFLTRDQLAGLFAKAKAKADFASMIDDDKEATHYRRVLDWMTLAYYWGARRTSVAELEVSQVLLDQELVSLSKPGEVATKKRRMPVPIYPEQHETLQRLVREAVDGWLFGRGYNPYKPFHALCIDCGLPEAKAKPHVLRHSRATHLLEDGTPIYMVAQLLGDSIETVQSVYAHVSPHWPLRSLTKGRVG
jgi:site-specific recombinase XerD